MEVVLASAYKEKLLGEVEGVVNQAIKNKLEKINPTKRYYTRNDLLQFLGIGPSTLTKLMGKGLRYVKLNDKTHWFDIMEVYEVLETMKR